MKHLDVPYSSKNTGCLLLPLAREEVSDSQGVFYLNRFESNFQEMLFVGKGTDKYIFGSSALHRECVFPKIKD